MMLKTLWQNHRGAIALVVLGHVLAALLGLVQIAIVHQALFIQKHAPGGIKQWLQANDVWLYASLLPLLFILSIASYRHLSRLGAKVLANMRQNLISAILALPYQQQEALGGAKIRTLLTLDLDNIGDAFRALPLLMFNLSLMACCLLYMLWLSPLYFTFYLGILAIAGLSARWLLGRSNHLLTEHRECEGELQQHLSAVVNGARELTLNQPRRQHFQRHVVGAAVEKARQSMVASEGHISIMVNWVTLLIFIILGALLLLADSPWAASQDILAGYVIMTLFIRGPVLSISSNLPILARGNVAWQQIQSAGLSTETRGQIHSTQQPSVVIETAKTSIQPLQSLTLRSASYHYEAKTSGEAGFTLGPVDLEINKGELLFVVGGNGSGKSTLAKMLCGLYAPTSGEVCINQKPVSDLAQLNRQISAVFFDFHLFEQVLDETGNAVSEQEVNQWLARLEMDKKVTYTAGKLSSTTLSQGQRKRLALIVACCENRSVLLFDEWAADQDPHFRRVFYEELLPWLKAQGKTVIAITHDDRYFSIADKVCKLEAGKLTSFYTENTPDNVGRNNEGDPLSRATKCGRKSVVEEVK